MHIAAAIPDFVSETAWGAYFSHWKYDLLGMFDAFASANEPPEPDGIADDDIRAAHGDGGDQWAGGAKEAQAAIGTIDVL